SDSRCPAEAVRSDGHRRPHHADAAARGYPGTDPRHHGPVEEGNCHAQGRRLDRRVRGLRMSIKQFRPMTAGTRFRSISGFDEVTRGTPEKSLLEPKKQSGGRNNTGHVTSRYKGGGHKKMYRI